MDIVVKGRKTEVPERFRRHVAEKLKLDKIQRIDGKVTRLDVEVSKEHNPRQADRSDRVEITLRHRGPVVRAEASAADPYGALDLAVEKLESRLRRQHDKRRCRRGRDRIPASEVAAVVRDAAPLNGVAEPEPAVPEQVAPPVRRVGSVVVEGDGPLVVREKTHRAAPMTLEQALYEMELVGHDFYLFVDAETKQPSVVYRRHAYDYGVIHLEPDALAGDASPEEAGGALGA
ncbi:ribosome hibernation-promoting factor, HPF/YfiA family [Streptomyces radicis]|uniref:Ribosome hibernation promoting factor n=1 Tax=Streptomyces radicis TaxID=1750517 RepID=A0A3A9WED4_9ACTN|nr:ribosome-associated translation inhibitor RaiA [Streptomyces radicis]RKN07784.1 ribosome-associated translation inhibitor RaiA [Streptomyces radicis]RKN20760.1 ribosome-associated translation inhibitor RaiA [Streptomyces radicis]